MQAMVHRYQRDGNHLLLVNVTPSDLNSIVIVSYLRSKAHFRSYPLSF